MERLVSDYSVTPLKEMCCDVCGSFAMKSECLDRNLEFCMVEIRYSKPEKLFQAHKKTRSIIMCE